MTTIERICIFCGKKPQSKNIEHVLPLWLIRMTGNPNRSVNLGTHWPTGKSRRYALDQFAFPACKKCNDDFSMIEQRVEVIVRRLSDNGEICNDDLYRLMDWLDKVRIGLWLGFRFLNKDVLGVDPKFHINTRVGKKDRVAGIYRVDSLPRGLSFVGADTFVFSMAPCSFMLRINNIMIFNISNDFLISKRMGFPYLDNLEVKHNDEGVALVHGEPQPGLGRKSFPILPNCWRIQPSITVYQVISPVENFTDRVDVIDSYLNQHNGIGRIFLETSENPNQFTEREGDFHVGNQDQYGVALFDLLSMETLESQNREFMRYMDLPMASNFTQDEREFVKERNRMAIKFNDIVIDKIRQSLLLRMKYR